MKEETFSLLPLVDTEDKNCPLKNRIRKNYRHISKWAKRTKTNCFRIYDRDIKEYPVAIDYYAGRFYIQYFFSDDDSDDAPIALKQKVHGVLCSLFAVHSDVLYSRMRIRRAKMQQYEKLDNSKQSFLVYEYGVKFKINLHDYLDTGLFLDHRETRQIVALQAKGKRVLNLFAYTCSFSVHAACRGSLSTVSVDLSNTYTSWGEDNFLLNGLSIKENVIIRNDCLKQLDQERALQHKYDIIVIDPPTISRSKKMDQMFDVQKDYNVLLTKALCLLSQEGTIFFSTNSRRFIFDETLFPSCIIKEISKKTIPSDFHNKKMHRSWEIKIST